MSKYSAKNTIQVKISFYDASVVYQMSNTVTGSALINKACSRLGTYEQWWFGLLAVDTRGIHFWIHMDKKVAQQNVRIDNDILNLKFAVKFYPIEFKSEVIQDCSNKIFYMHLREMLLSEQIYCDAAGCVSLAALHLQYSRGDLSTSNDVTKIVEKDFNSLIPAGMVKRHDMSQADWIDVIVKMWQAHRFLLKHEAMAEHLKIIQDLDMYGVRYYSIRNKKKSNLLLGVEPGGMNIYREENKMIPRVSLAWSEIRSISYVDKKFVIKCIEKNSPDFTMYSQHTKENNIIMHICVGNHELYMLRRRTTDPDDVRLLKEKARAAQNIVEEEYKCEIALKAKKIEYEEQMNSVVAVGTEDRVRFETEMKSNYDENMAHLEQKMNKLSNEAEKARLEAGMSQEEIERLRKEKEAYSLLAEEERLSKERMMKSESEARTKAAEAAEEAERVRSELEELKRVYAEDQKRLKELQNAAPVAGEVQKVKKDYKTIRKEKTQQATAQVQQVNNMLATKMSTQTQDDKVHGEIVKTGVNKFKTLRSIRNGNTRARIDEFESM